MEIIDDDAERANIQFVKINDKRLGKSFGIKKFPALTMIRFLSIKNLLKIDFSIQINSTKHSLYKANLTGTEMCLSTRAT